MYLINDKSEYNDKYRLGIKNELSSRGILVNSVGVFDGFFSGMKVILFLAFKRQVYISSNMKSNLFCLFAFWSKGLIIVNGLGRYKYSSFFRISFSFLLFLNSSSKVIIFQNYSDYRYFKRNVKARIFWVPGSGGISREINIGDDVLIISRNDKISKVYDSVLKFFLFMNGERKIVFVGCSPSEVKNKFNNDKIVGIGRVKQSDIFKQSNYFFQPRGYGEGVPHSLVDAICSGMTIIITKKDFVSFGLYVLGFEFNPLNYEFGHLYFTDEVSSFVSQNEISKLYVDIFIDNLV
ncbi:hypothetical protein P0F09_002802 [Vibrio metschnikovii]|nr:hypothetical protein [Vibrio metschnikovii]EKO3604300.1 hypothetical protein [Vibrio metschnikovii]EKQ5811752.1 hypothetical protein [Vibrio metschnikovii]